jgi:hypothetical protein
MVLFVLMMGIYAKKPTFTTHKAVFKPLRLHRCFRLPPHTTKLKAANLPQQLTFLLRKGIFTQQKAILTAKAVL